MSKSQDYSAYKTLSTNNENGQTEVVYYNTKIVQFDNDIIRLNTGDWWTMSTKSRMNSVSRHYHLGYRVFSRKGIWYVSYQDKEHKFEATAITINRQTGDVIPQ